MNDADTIDMQALAVHREMVRHQQVLLSGRLPPDLIGRVFDLGFPETPWGELNWSTIHE